VSFRASHREVNAVSRVPHLPVAAELCHRPPVPHGPGTLGSERSRRPIGPGHRRGLARQAQHRCLILADGYYEWQRPEDPRQPRRPVHFSLASDEPFCFAGLWTRWRSPDCELVPSCAIVTCSANTLTRPIHDRMPVILADPEAWECWLDSAVDCEAACELLLPLPSERMVARPANPILNSARHEGPDCLAALGRVAGAPGPRARQSPAGFLDPGRHRSAGRSRTAARPACFTTSRPAASVGSLPGPTFAGGPGVVFSWCLRRRRSRPSNPSGTTSRLGCHPLGGARVRGIPGPRQVVAFWPDLSIMERVAGAGRPSAHGRRGLDAPHRVC
jgi:hypothetical protein